MPTFCSPKDYIAESERDGEPEAGVHGKLDQGAGPRTAGQAGRLHRHQSAGLPAPGERSGREGLLDPVPPDRRRDRRATTYTIGTYPHEYKIAGARVEALRVRPLLRVGKDPKAERKIEIAAEKKIAVRQITLAEVAPLYVTYFRFHKPGKDGALGRRSWDTEAQKLHNVCVNYGWGEKVLDQVSDDEAAKLLDTIRDRDRNPNRIHSDDWSLSVGAPAGPSVRASAA